MFFFSLWWWLLVEVGSPLSVGPERKTRRWLLETAVLSSLAPPPASAIINGEKVSMSEAAKSGTVGLWIDLDDCEVCRHDVPAACTGVLVGPQLVLSAQHCLDIPEQLGGYLTKVVFSNDIFAKNAKTVAVEQYLRPKDVGLGSTNDYANDLVLIKLKEPAPENWRVANVIPPALTTFDNDLGLTKPKVNLYGFGDTVDSQDDYTSGVLHKIQLNAISPVASATPKFYTASNTKTSGSCNGDSGGPAFRSNSDGSQIIGVLSSNTMPCSGSQAIFMNPAFFKAFLQKASTKLGAPIPGL